MATVPFTQYANTGTVAGNVAALTALIAAEGQDRIAAVANSDAAIAAEASARAAAISSEASTRASAVSAEASTRATAVATAAAEAAAALSAAQATIDAAIAAEAATRAAAVSAEAAARAAAVSAEASTRSAEVSAESDARIAAISSEASTRAAAVAAEAGIRLAAAGIALQPSSLDLDDSTRTGVMNLTSSAAWANGKRYRMAGLLRATFAGDDVQTISVNVVVRKDSVTGPVMELASLVDSNTDAAYVALIATPQLDITGSAIGLALEVLPTGGAIPGPAPALTFAFSGSIVEIV